MAECNAHLETYSQASLNGVPFYADSLSDQFGRRGPIHEFPDRDIGAAEDLGRSQGRYNVSGWVGGDDHVAQARRLKAAAERVSPATLVHPIWGTVKVKVDSVTISHDVEREQRVTKISIQATEFGGAPFPSAARALGGLIGGLTGGLTGGLAGALTGTLTGSIGDALGEMTGGLSDAIGGAFDDVFSVVNFTQASVEQIDNAISDIASEIRQDFVQLVEWNDYTPDVLDILDEAQTNPALFRKSPHEMIIVSMASLQENARDQEAAVDAFDRLMTYGSGDIEARGPKRAQIEANVNMLISAVRTTAAMYAVKAATESVIPDLVIATPVAEYKTLPAPVSRFSTSVDAYQFLDRVSGVLDQEIRIAQTAQTFQADRGGQRNLKAARNANASNRRPTYNDYLRKLRDGLHESIEELRGMALNLPPLMITDLGHPLPSLVAAYRATGDARRVLEVEARNPSRSKWFLRREIEHRGVNAR